MSTVNDVARRVAFRVHDRDFKELDIDDYIGFINDAIDDLTASGWLLPMTEDTSLTFTTDVYQYSVPAGFAYLKDIIIADSAGDYPEENTIPNGQWRILATAKIEFKKDYFDMAISGRAIRLSGQKRPSQSVVPTDTISPGMEAFVRERAVTYAAEHLSSVASELAPARQVLANQNWAKSNAMLAWHPAEFRVKPNSRYVPGR